MNALDTHDTPRFLTNAKPGVVPVAFGMSVTLPGIPVVFAGDEFGLTGVDGEASRTPLPWGSEEGAAAGSIALYSSLIGLRRAHSALNGGGMRWLHVSPDVLVYVREDANESILVVAARAAYDLTLPPGLVSTPADGVAPLVGSGSLRDGQSGIHLTGAGPSFTAWRLPGIALPAFGG
jgi:alpha-glucosidase